MDASGEGLVEPIEDDRIREREVSELRVRVGAFFLREDVAGHGPEDLRLEPVELCEGAFS